MRRASVLVAATLAACTAANPEYLGQSATSCNEGVRACATTRPVICQDRVLTTVWCPSGAVCSSGRCVQPESASACFSDRDCMGGRVCTAVVDATRPQVITTFCLAPEGITEGADACRKAQECRSALCLPAAGVPGPPVGAGICYRACRNDGDCVSGTRCRDFDMEITGVRGTIKGCDPV